MDDIWKNKCSRSHTGLLQRIIMHASNEDWIVDSEQILNPQMCSAFWRMNVFDHRSKKYDYIFRDDKNTILSTDWSSWNHVLGVVPNISKYWFSSFAWCIYVTHYITHVEPCVISLQSKKAPSLWNKYWIYNRKNTSLTFKKWNQVSQYK